MNSLNMRALNSLLRR